MNILIADDEQIILKWLKKNIEAISPEYHVVEVCANGKQALSNCRNQKIDVLFTDIRMPVMDGMELLQKLQENGGLPYTIILSAYDDFSYVRDAFKLGANEFLLKPEITEEGLRECLQLASARLQHRRKETEDTAADSLQQILEKFLLGGELPEAEILRKQWRINCDGTGEMASLLLLEEPVSGIGDQLQELTQFVYGEEHLVFRTVPLSSKRWAVFSEAPPHGTLRFTEKLSETWASFGFHQVRFGMSGAHGCEALTTMREEAEEQLEYARYYGLYGSCPLPDAMQAQEVLDKCAKAVVEAMQEETFDEVSKQIEELVHHARALRPAPAQVRRVAVNLLLQCYWERVTEEERSGITLEELMAVTHAATLEELVYQVKQQVERFTVLLKNRRVQLGCSEAVSRAMRFIEQNFAQPVSLEDVAASVHLNRSYLSSLFKKETGENVFDYLLRCRMEKAKQLLPDKRYSVQQVCAEVGIADAAYFSKLFKKYTGVTPLEFRRSAK